MNWLDLGIVIAVGIILFISIKRGLMNSVLSHFSLGTNMLLSFFLCKPIQLLLNKGFHLGSAISTHYYTALVTKSSDFATNLLSFENAETLHSFVKGTIKKGDFNFISRTMYNWFINKKSLYDTLHESGLTSRSLADIISASLASFFTVVIAFIISLVLIYLLVLLFRLFANKLRTIGFVKVVDNTLGVFYGLFKCLIIFIFLFFIIKLFSPLKFMEPVVSYINGSFFGKLIFGQISNFLDNWLGFKDIIHAIFK